MTSSKMRENVPSVTDELQPGTELMRGQYKITRYLNSGGFGITYLATDSLDRSVVIKECFPRSFCYRGTDMAVHARSESQSGDLRSIVRLFANEARAMAKLTHPHIVGVHQTFEENNTAYMALDFVKGHDLLAVIEQKVMLLRPDQVRAILEKVLDAIGFVHKQGLLHRDISPDNIIVSQELNPVLIDFGAAREQASKASRALSALRVVKDGYSPQEFYIAGSEQGPFSDLYSLAASFYQLITGDLPPDSQLRISAHVAGEPDPYVPLGKKTSDYDESFCEALDKAMSVLPANRIQSADEWMALMAKPVSMSRRMSRKRSRQRSSRLTKPLAPQASNARLSQMRVLGFSAVGLAAAAAAGVFVAPMLSAPSSFTPASGQQVAAVATDVTPETVIPGQGTVDPAKGPTLESFVQSYADGAVVTHVALDLPFEVDANNTITGVGDTAPAWLETGLQIVEVNGTSLAADSAFFPVALAATVFEGGAVSALNLVLANAEADTRTLGQLSVPVSFETQVQNDLTFATWTENGEWITRVIEAGPETSGLQVGDTVLGLVSSDERLESGDALAKLLDDAVAKGATAIDLAVNRDGLVWIAEIAVTPSDS